MAKIRLGRQHGDSTSQSDLSLAPESNLEFETGEQYDRSRRVLRVRETDPRTEAAPADGSALPGKRDGRATALWAKGSFFLVAFGTVGAVIGILAQKLRWYLVPVSIVGAIIVLYLLATILIPGGPLTEKGLISVLQSYMRLAFTVNAKTNGTAAAPGNPNDRR
jgi:hypothetical protein